jgi:hypothetical protein
MGRGGNVIRRGIEAERSTGKSAGSEKLRSGYGQRGVEKGRHGYDKMVGGARAGGNDTEIEGHLD